MAWNIVEMMEIFPDSYEKEIPLLRKIRDSCTIETVKKAVATTAHTSISDIEKNSPGVISHPRKVAIALSCRLTRASRGEIANAFALRSSSTVTFHNNQIHEDDYLLKSALKHIQKTNHKKS